MPHPDLPIVEAPGWPAGSAVAAVLALTLALGGCARGAQDAEPLTQDVPPAGITLEELRSAAYPADLLDGSLVRLTDGVFPPPDSTGEPLASLELADPVAIAEPGAAVAAAAVVVRESGGGTGMFAWLHLLQRRTGTATVVASTYLGDRVDLVGLRLLGDTIEVRLVTQGPNDPLCCPTLEVWRRFRREGAALKEVKSRQ